MIERKNLLTLQDAREIVSHAATVPDIQYISDVWDDDDPNGSPNVTEISNWYGKDVELEFPNAGAHTARQLREGIERFMITDINNPAGSAQAQSEVSVMWDHCASKAGGGLHGAATYNHVPGGSNILFLDGHAEFAKYPQEEGTKYYWMMTRTFVPNGGFALQNP